MNGKKYFYINFNMGIHDIRFKGIGEVVNKVNEIYFLRILYVFDDFLIKQKVNDIMEIHESFLKEINKEDIIFYLI